MRRTDVTCFVPLSIFLGLLLQQRCVSLLRSRSMANNSKASSEA